MRFYTWLRSLNLNKVRWQRAQRTLYTPGPGSTEQYIKHMRCVVEGSTTRPRKTLAKTRCNRHAYLSRGNIVLCISPEVHFFTQERLHLLNRLLLISTSYVTSTYRMRYEYNSATSAVSVILAAALLHLAKGQSTCQESKTLLARNNSYPSVRCQSSTLNMLAFSWDSIYVYDCKLLPPSSSSKRSVTMSGGCLKNGIDANVTFGPIDLDKNAHSVACEYSGSGSCSDSYSLLVYDPGVLQLTSTVRTGSSTQSASVQNSGNSTQSPLTLQPNSATKFNFTCSFTTCGGTHEARYAWFITTDSVSTAAIV